MIVPPWSISKVRVLAILVLKAIVGPFVMFKVHTSLIDPPKVIVEPEVVNVPPKFRLPVNVRLPTLAVEDTNETPAMVTAPKEVELVVRVPPVTVTVELPTVKVPTPELSHVVTKKSPLPKSTVPAVLKVKIAAFTAISEKVTFPAETVRFAQVNPVEKVFVAPLALTTKFPIVLSSREMVCVPLEPPKVIVPGLEIIKLLGVKAAKVKFLLKFIALLAKFTV